MRRRTTVGIFVLSALCATACALWPAPARAHPMGNFSVSHHTTLRAAPDGLHVRYRIDMAEIATAQEMPSLDVDGNREVSDGERQAYLARVVPELTSFQTLKVGGSAVRLVPARSDLQLRPGAADLPTLLLTVEYLVPLEAGRERYAVEYVDNSFEERSGWREIVANAGEGFAVAESTVRAESRSDELEQYPTDLAFVPPQQRDARVVYTCRPGATTAPSTAPTTGDAASAAPPPPAKSSTPRDRFTDLITTREWSAGVLLLSLGVAFVLGSFHALSPGHGKTVVAAYLVGSRGTARHAVFLGAIVTFTHVFAVFLLGFVVMFASAYVVPERLYPWLGFASGVLIVAIGLWQFLQRYAALKPAGHYHNGTFHSHAGGWFAHDHSHGPGGHTHELPDRITPGALIALGVSGGIVPCPSALVVLLSAVALNRVALGLVLIVAFSAGLAFVLILIGLLMLYARKLMDRFDWEGRDRGLLRALPVASSAIIAVLGVIIAAQALLASGIL